MAQLWLLTTMLRMPAAQFRWHLWPARNWPASVAEEHQFVADLNAHIDAGTQSPKGLTDIGRADITVVVNALRTGISYNELLRVLPGLEPQRLLYAYELLDQRRVESTNAWHKFTESLDRTTDPSVVAGAARLLPLVVHRVLARASGQLDDQSYQRLINGMQRTIKETCNIAWTVERQLVACRAQTQVQVTLGARLHNLDSPGIWSSPFYLPRRVTDLAPVRVADLVDGKDVRFEPGRAP